MTYRYSRVFLASLAAAVLLAALPAAGAEGEFPTLPEGEKAPPLKTVTIDGQPFDLLETASSKGVVLFFWSLFCSPCREEMPLIEKMGKDLAAEPLEIVAVNLDEPPLHNAVRSFLRSSGLTFKVIVGKTAQLDSKADKLFQITGTPVVYLISRDGTIAYGHVGRLEDAELRKLVREKLLAGGP